MNITAFEIGAFFIAWTGLIFFCGVLVGSFVKVVSYEERDLAGYIQKGHRR